MKIILRWFIILLPFLAGAQEKKSFSIYFDFNHFDLKSSAKSALDSFLKTRPTASVRIELNGYCDVIGGDQYNDALSVRRVNAVKEWLVSVGIHEDLIVKAEGHGKRLPLNENKTPEERQLNRRVQIYINDLSNDTVLVTEQTIKTENPKDDRTLKEKIGDTAITKGSRIILRNINFIGGTHHLMQESEPALQELLDALRAYPQLVIEIQGHVCCIPDNSDGLDLESNSRNLSETRAHAIYNYLIDHGIANSRLTWKGFGHSYPIFPYPETSEEERIQNRRVEIRIINK